MSKKRLIDLSHTYHKHWKSDVELVPISRLEDGDLAAITKVTIRTHEFTHVDAPAHMIVGGLTLPDLPVDCFWGEACVIDLQDMPDSGVITGDDLESRGKDVRRGDIALLCSAIELRYSWETPAFWANSPYLDRSAANWLVDRGIKCVGYDFSQEFAIRKMYRFPADGSYMPLTSKLTIADWPVHEVLLSAGVIQVEHLTNLHKVRQPRPLFFALPLKLGALDGGPCRAFALEED